ncbi:DNA cytosine methyltransferase [Listeria cossartiae subsp. cayugensis]|uniref:DNA cytosine methyltransferase n=1 Tax=Listeria cossartiae TaxID=2838249 RepID=UPI002880B521|nr:DNA cytosine methyltransferase [Listeria cossartiae]MDS9999512.1 DNA cytosine methyltransferase [Listeria cossartiae subsp. cayugensis]MDT0008041.1 DNA cytosine methyltransferase [Listeria cossartiae subsp. cayugensis]MDT0029544.1 DNA cytosine methyltransferase [Listeria cossartiae subsp. cayugensis]MDT0037659.1 DNA cytosine methyltransferase [Listeria cossartiae subsp. cayugensis]MDT0043009.1 DNA cytosine methyltransferase [Listeria cossartiae subsp. cayugensis]
MNIKLFSFFSGLGLLDLGFEKAGFEIVEIFEKKKEFLGMYKYSREKLGYSLPKYGCSLIDVENLLDDKNFELKVETEKKMGLVGFIGGPPCPDFSIAGKNKGAEGDNGRLSTIYFELIKKYKPDFFLFENVKGIWKTKKNRVYIEQKMNEMSLSGYEVAFDILNSLDFGVPQDRERFLMFGLNQASIHLGKNKKNPDIFGLLSSTVNNKNSYEWPITDEFKEMQVIEKPEKINEMLTVEYWFKKNDVYNHPNAKDFFKPKSLLKFETIKEGDISKKSFKRIHRWRYSPTAAYGNNEVHLHPYLTRRLSVAEALAIQSAPKNFELPINFTLTDKFKAVGNAVPFLMAEGIAEEIKKTLGEDENEILRKNKS